MMTQNQIKILRGFLIESKMTQQEFSKEAGICERTLRTAIKTGKVSDKTWSKILDAIMAETMQIKMIAIPTESQAPKFLYTTLRICWLVLGAFAVFMLLNCIFG